MDENLAIAGEQRTRRQAPRGVRADAFPAARRSTAPASAAANTVKRPEQGMPAATRDDPGADDRRQRRRDAEDHADHRHQFLRCRDLRNNRGSCARPTIRPTPAHVPCSARNASSIGIDCASAQPADATRNTPTPPRITDAPAPGVGQRTDQQRHRCVGHQVNADRLLHRQRSRVELRRDRRKRRKNRVDAERPEHGQGRQQECQPVAAGNGNTASVLIGIGRRGARRYAAR